MLKIQITTDDAVELEELQKDLTKLGFSTFKRRYKNSIFTVTTTKQYLFENCNKCGKKTTVPLIANNSDNGITCSDCMGGW